MQSQIKFIQFNKFEARIGLTGHIARPTYNKKYLKKRVKTEIDFPSSSLSPFSFFFEIHFQCLLPMAISYRSATFISVGATIFISRRLYDVTGRIQDAEDNFNLLAEIQASGGYVVITPAFFTQKREVDISLMIYILLRFWLCDWSMRWSRSSPVQDWKILFFD